MTFSEKDAKKIYTVAEMLDNDSSKKIPYAALIVHRFEILGDIVSLVLKDPTGFICASLPAKLVKTGFTGDFLDLTAENTDAEINGDLQKFTQFYKEIELEKKHTLQVNHDPAIRQMIQACNSGKFVDLREEICIILKNTTLVHWEFENVSLSISEKNIIGVFNMNLLGL